MLEGLRRQARCPVREVPAAAASGHAPGEVEVGGYPEVRLPNVDDFDADPHEACSRVVGVVGVVAWWRGRPGEGLEGEEQEAKVGDQRLLEEDFMLWGPTQKEEGADRVGGTAVEVSGTRKVFWTKPKRTAIEMTYTSTW